MNNCIICGKSVEESEDIKQTQTAEGTAAAHASCLTTLHALLAQVGEPAPLPDTKSDETSILERHGDDWILTRRTTSVTTMILAYLQTQSQPSEAKAIYDWLDRNEVKCSNPSEYIRKMRNRGEIAVLNVDGTRMVRLTRKGVDALKKTSEQRADTVGPATST